MSKEQISFSTYREKVLGCWLGKAVGGTLGGPWEGVPLPSEEVTFYDPVPDEMLPNDDLDLQVVWLQAIRERGLPIDRRLLATAWRDNVHLWPGEYGICRVNLDRGLFPPVTGLFDNGQSDGMGAAIRTELWACLAPGAPELAAHLAREDACCDHAGTGVDAAVFLAVLESAAFTEKDRDRLLDRALDAIPEESRIACAVRLVRRAWAETPDRQHVLDRLLDQHYSQDFTSTPMNLGIIVLGWLAGGGDFGRSITAAVNCGQDTDCTCASLGALLGILAPGGLGEEWLEPIGRDLVLSPGMTGMSPANDLDGLTDQVADLAQQVLGYYGADVVLEGAPTPTLRVPRRMPERHVAHLRQRRTTEPRTSLIASEPVEVTLRYPEQVSFTPGVEAEMTLVVRNLSAEPVVAPVDVRAPEGWAVETVRRTGAERLSPGEESRLALQVVAGEQRWRPYRSRLGISVGVGAARRDYTAGLVMSIPFAAWTLDEWPGEARPDRPEGAVLIESPSHFMELEKAPAAPGQILVLQTHIKIPFHARPRFVTQALRRRTQTWLNERLLHEQPGHYANAAIHLAGHTGVDLDLRRGGYELTFVVGPQRSVEALLEAEPLAHEAASLLNSARAEAVAQLEGDRLYFAIGYGDLWRWMEDLEFQNPLEWPSPSGKAQPTFGLAEV